MVGRDVAEINTYKSENMWKVSAWVMVRFYALYMLRVSLLTLASAKYNTGQAL